MQSLYDFTDFGLLLASEINYCLQLGICDGEIYLDDPRFLSYSLYGELTLFRWASTLYPNLGWRLFYATPNSRFKKPYLYWNKYARSNT